MMLFIVTLTCYCILLYAEARAPGFKIKVTQKGLNYVSDIAIDFLEANVKNFNIPTQTGSNYVASNIKVKEFTPPGSTISTVPGIGLSWKTLNGYIRMEADFRYKVLFFWVSGQFSVKFNGVNFDVGISLVKDSTGMGSIFLTSCAGSISNVDLVFQGSWAWLYNVFRGIAGNVIKDGLNSQMCALITTAVNTNVNKMIKDLPMTVILADNYLLDYRLTDSPLFTPDYLETSHKGEIFWAAAPTEEATLTAPPMPDTANSSQLYLSVSDYIANTLLYNAQKHGVLVYNLTKTDLPPDARDVLNTTCIGWQCVGKFIPEIGKQYPNGELKLHMATSHAPVLRISSTGVFADLEGDIKVYANIPGERMSLIMLLGAQISAAINVSVENQTLYGNVIDISASVTVKSSEVGEIHDAVLTFIAKNVINIFLIPKMNELGKRGFPLLITPEFGFLNTSIIMAENTLIVATDVKFTPRPVV